MHSNAFKEKPSAKGRKKKKQDIVRKNVKQKKTPVEQMAPCFQVYKDLLDRGKGGRDGKIGE